MISSWSGVSYQYNKSVLTLPTQGHMEDGPREDRGRDWRDVAVCQELEGLLATLSSQEKGMRWTLLRASRPNQAYFTLIWGYGLLSCKSVNFCCFNLSL